MSVTEWLFEVKADHHVHQIVLSIVPRALARGVVLDEPAAAAMVVWAMLRWENTLARQAIESSNVDLAHLERQIDVLLEKYQRPEPRSAYRSGERIVQPYDIGGVRALVRQADAEAKELGHEWCGAEHFLLAALVIGDDDLRGVFQSFCLDRETLRPKVVRMLQS